jgi:hypothetical protein
MKKNFFSGWTIRQVLVILISSLTLLENAAAAETVVPAVTEANDGERAELAVARQEFQALRRELEAVLLRAEAQQEEYDRLQLSAVALLAGEGASSRRASEASLLVALEETAAAGRTVTDEVLAVCRMLEATLDEETIPAAERARIRARLAGLRVACERFNDRVRVPERQEKAWESCRIVAVDDRLQVVVLAAGSVQGIGCGLGLRAGDEKDSVRLRVIAVRPHVSAALVVEGDLGRLAPGMMARAGDRSGSE